DRRTRLGGIPVPPRLREQQVPEFDLAALRPDVPRPPRPAPLQLDGADHLPVAVDHEDTGPPPRHPGHHLLQLLPRPGPAEVGVDLGRRQQRDEASPGPRRGRPQHEPGGTQGRGRGGEGAGGWAGGGGGHGDRTGRLKDGEGHTRGERGRTAPDPWITRPFRARTSRARSMRSPSAFSVRPFCRRRSTTTSPSAATPSSPNRMPSSTMRVPPCERCRYELPRVIPELPRRAGAG